MSHVLIQNQGELPLWGLRLLGLSTKNSNQIGKFGTGLKESIALMIRMGMSPIIFSGTCRFDFDVQEHEGQQEIFFKMSEPRGQYPAAEWIGLGMHPNFGKHDWQDPWMIFREIMCNAIDESGVEGLYHDVSSTEPKGVAGATRCYIPLTPDTLRAYGESQHRLLMLDADPAIYNDTAVLDKNEPGPVQIFHKGVWVQQGKDNAVPSLFNYNLPYLNLNESRSADWHDVHIDCSGLLVNLDPTRIDLFLDNCLSEKNDKFFEMTILRQANYRMDVEKGKHWKRVFERKHGEDAVLCTNDTFSFDKLRERGKVPVVVPHPDLYRLLSNAGIPNVATILTQEDTEFESINKAGPATMARATAIWLFLCEMTEREVPPLPTVKIVTSRDDTMSFPLGRVSKNDSTIYIHRQYVGSSTELKGLYWGLSQVLSNHAPGTDAFAEFLLYVGTKAFEYYDRGANNDRH